ATGFNIGQVVNHYVTNFLIQDFELFNNAKTQGGISPDICGPWGVALELPGSDNITILDGYVHDNYCAGINPGSGIHTYPRVNRVLLRRVRFEKNGRFNTPNSIKTGTEGGG